MDERMLTTLEPPRFENSKTLLIAGLSERYDGDSSKAIPAQWQRFMPYIGNIPGQIGRTAYGVCCNSDEEGNFDYICGVEVADFSELPPELARLRIPARRYAVFTHRDHISTIRRTVNTIWNSGCRNRVTRSPTHPTSSVTVRSSILRPEPAASRSGYRWQNSAPPLFPHPARAPRFADLSRAGRGVRRNFPRPREQVAGEGFMALATLIRQVYAGVPQTQSCRSRRGRTVP